MPTVNTPLKLSPIFKTKIWGRDDLSPLFDWPDLAGAGQLHAGTAATPNENQSDLIGEAWITDDSSTILNGPVAGSTLGEVSSRFRSDLNGPNWKSRRFPLLSKYVFTSEWLSLQVHPDDGYARKHESGSLGKCEMWYIVGAEPDAEFLLGLKPNVTTEMLRAACDRGESKDLLNRFHPKAGEAIFVPPGTVHALGPGLVVFEVEENSDITYRLDDYGRKGLDGKPRPLHLDKGLAVAKLESPPFRNLPRRTVRERFGSRRYVLACPYFAVEELTLQKTGRFKSSTEHVETLSVISGEGRVETASGWLGYRAGDTWVIPPAAGQYRLAPVEKTKILKYYVPDVDKDFRRPLSRHGFKSAQIKTIVFD